MDEGRPYQRKVGLGDTPNNVARDLVAIHAPRSSFKHYIRTGGEFTANYCCLMCSCLCSCHSGPSFHSAQSFSRSSPLSCRGQVQGRKHSANTGGRGVHIMQIQGADILQMQGAHTFCKHRDQGREILQIQGTGVYTFWGQGVYIFANRGGKGKIQDSAKI